MNLKSYLLYTIALLSLVLILQCCETKQPAGIYNNDKINSGLRDDIHKLNDRLIAATNENSLQGVEALLSQDMLSNNEYKHTAEMISNQSKSGKYTVLDEYYINSLNPGHRDVLSPANGTYKISLQSTAAQSYLSLLLVETGGDQWLITAVYSKLDYGWRITELDFGHYSINGKNAPQMMAFAKQQYAKGYLINAYSNMELATKCLRPAPIWEYKNEKEIAEYFGKLSGEANRKFQFPIVIPIPSRPQIFRIMTQTQPGGGYVPTVKYVTKANVRDSVALKKEFELIKPAIGKVLPGIDHDNKRIIFSAYNERPSGNASPFSFDMVYDLK
jgi:hypothetical protein